MTDQMFRNVEAIKLLLRRMTGYHRHFSDGTIQIHTEAINAFDEIIELLAQNASLKAEVLKQAAASSIMETQLQEAREALEQGVELISGDAVGKEWKQGCAAFLRRAREVHEGE